MKIPRRPILRIPYVTHTRTGWPIFPGVPWFAPAMVGALVWKVFEVVWG